MNLLAPNAQVLQLIDDQSGQQWTAVDMLGSDRHAALLLYSRLHRSRKTGEGQVLCEICGVPVYLASRQNKQSFYFKHFQEDGNCPAQTRGEWSEAQINALRYHGQRESKRHIRIKELLASSLREDLMFSEPVVEGTWKGREGKEYRRPDVRSTYQGRLAVAFEVQLSTTFGRVMAEREVFYKQEGALLLWVFGEFTVEHARLMMEVVFANNNRNAFIVNEATCAASVEQGQLMLECVWAQPALHEGNIVWSQRRKLVGFHELTIDLARQRAFYFDADAAERSLLEELEGPGLDVAFQDYWLDYENFDGRTRDSYQVLEERWAQLSRRFRAVDVTLPRRFDDQLQNLTRVLLLAKHRRAVGWGYTEFWPAVHHVHDAHKDLLWIFMPALQHYGRLAGIEEMDSHGKWAAKVSDWKAGTKASSAKWAEAHELDAVIRHAFPELAGTLASS